MSGAPSNSTVAPTVTRFAPSPTGQLHLGHALAALVAWQAAQQNGGQFLLRIEDIDRTRCRPEFEDALSEDLAWLGIRWPEPVWRQSSRSAAYAQAMDRLRALDLVYPCFCTRAEIERETTAMVQAPHGPEGPLYPGTCRGLSKQEQESRCIAGEAHAWRLDSGRAGTFAGPLEWTDRRRGRHLVQPEVLGDVVLARKDIGTSYHVAVVVDDAAQGVSLVTRGDDLFPSTHLHRLLQHLLGLPVPEWAHHPLVLDDAGRRLAKRDLATSLRSLREEGVTPDGVISRLSWALEEMRSLTSAVCIR